MLQKIWLWLVLAGLCLLVSTYLLNGYFLTSWRVATEGKHAHIIPFNSVTFFNSSDGVGITSLSIKRTSDEGETWVTSYENVDMGLYSLAFTNKENGWVVGSEREATNPSEKEHQLASSDNKHPLILRTNNSGLDWQRSGIEEAVLNRKGAKFSTFSSVCFDVTNKMWIVGDGGIVEATDERGTLKVLDITPTEDALYSVACNQEDIWAVGKTGIVMHYRNDWTKTNLGSDTFFSKVRVFENDVWLVGGTRLRGENEVKGILLRSRDNGQTWENRTPDSANGLFDIYINNKSGWLVGANGSIFYTKDNGSSWVASKSPTENDLFQVFFLNPENGWIVGDKATVLRYGK